MIRSFLVLFLGAGAAFADVPRVVTDVAPVHGLVSMVMGDLGTPDVILPPGASPHHYAMRPSEARSLSRSDLIVWVGHGLTPWLEGPLDTLAPDTQRLELMASKGTTLLPKREAGLFGGHDHGEAQDDDHRDEDGHAHEEEHTHEEEHGHDDGHGHGGAQGATTVDPHLWLSPENATVWVSNIAEALSRLDPENETTYRSNALAASERINAQADQIKRALDPVKDKKFVVMHDAFQYFTTYFDMAPYVAVKSVEADQPGASRIALLRDALAKSGVVCAFSEPQYDVSLLETVTGDLDIGLGTLDPLGADIPMGPDHYVQLLASVSDGLSECLSR